MNNHTVEKPTWQVILEVGAEGGSLSIARFGSANGEWRFVAQRDESAMASFLDEEDLQGLSLAETSGSVATFLEALEILGKYPWYRLSPLVLHAECEEIVLAEVLRLGGEECLMRWKHRF